MRERISRSDDEKLYQPAIHSRHIRRLHQISEVTGEPMTVLVDQAIREFVSRRDDAGNIRGNSHPEADRGQVEGGGGE